MDEAATTAATKKCPACAELILAEALKCKHCGEWLDGRATAPRAHADPDRRLGRALLRALAAAGGVAVLALIARALGAGYARAAWAAHEPTRSQLAASIDIVDRATLVAAGLVGVVMLGYPLLVGAAGWVRTGRGQLKAFALAFGLALLPLLLGDHSGLLTTAVFGTCIAILATVPVRRPAARALVATVVGAATCIAVLLLLTQLLDGSLVSYDAAREWSDRELALFNVMMAANLALLVFAPAAIGGSILLHGFTADPG